MTRLINLYRSLGDTRRIVFSIKSKKAPAGEDITSWGNWSLIVDPEKNPLNGNNNVGNFTPIVVDALKGEIGFIPNGTIPEGTYYYKAKATDENNELVTFAYGVYKVI